MDLFHQNFPSPVGMLRLVATAEGLSEVRWDGILAPIEDRAWTTDRSHPVLQQAEAELQAYFGGHRRSFSVPLAPHGTDFQKQVWRALLTIPYGQTRSYQDIARQLGNPGSARAVGAANRRNPLGIFIPCHRVIGSSGQLVGFTGGLPVQQALLDLESRTCPHDPYCSSDTGSIRATTSPIGCS